MGQKIHMIWSIWSQQVFTFLTHFSDLQKWIRNVYSQEGRNLDIICQSMVEQKNKLILFSKQTISFHFAEEDR